MTRWTAWAIAGALVACGEAAGPDSSIQQPTAADDRDLPVDDHTPVPPLGRQDAQSPALDPPSVPDAQAGVPITPGAPGASATPHAQPPSASARWSTYGFDDANTQVNSSETVLRADNVVGLQERWRVKFGAGGTSTPIVYDGTVYFGDWEGYAYAVDAESGELRWRTRLTELLIRSTPLVTQDRVFIAAGPNLAALDRRDGSVRYQTPIATHPETVLDSSPKWVDGLVIIGASAVENTFMKDQYVWTGSIVALDAESGTELWRIATTGTDAGRCSGGPGVSVWSSAAIDRELGLAYIGTGQNFAGPVSACSDSLIAFHYAREHAGDRIAWIAQYTAGDIFASAPASATSGPDADIGTSPNLFEAGGRPLVGAGDKAGSYRVFDRRTGEPVWRRVDLGIGAFHQAGGVRTTAAVHGGTVFVASNILSQASLLTASLTGSLQPGEGSHLHALNAETGESRWMIEVPSTIDGAIVIANGVLYHTANQLGLYARDLATGVELWHSPLPANIGAGPSVVDGRLYVSAGYNVATLSTAAPNADGGQVISYGLEVVGAPRVWQAPREEPRLVTAAECSAAVSGASDWPGGGMPSAECAACLCECNATAAASCDTCWLQAPCAVQSCSLAAAGAGLYDCMAVFCVSKLLPSTLFQRSVDVAPCAIGCAAVCGF